MRHRITLTATSVLSVLLFSLHWADEIARGMEPGTLSAAGGLLILFIWLYAALVLTDRRWGLVVLLLFSLMGAAVPLLHMSGAGLISRHIANTSGIFFWVWTLLALSATATMSVALSARALWELRRSR